MKVNLIPILTIWLLSNGPVSGMSEMLAHYHRVLGGSTFAASAGLWMPFVLVCILYLFPIAGKRHRPMINSLATSVQLNVEYKYLIRNSGVVVWWRQTTQTLDWVLTRIQGNSYQQKDMSYYQPAGLTRKKSHNLIRSLKIVVICVDNNISTFHQHAEKKTVLLPLRTVNIDTRAHTHTRTGSAPTLRTIHHHP